MLEPLFAEATDFRMAWVFIDMLKTDTLDSAKQSAARVNDARLTAFHDPSHCLGRAMARCLGWKQHLAWDTYFIYGPAAHWTGEGMPFPDFWRHQLQDREVWERTAEAELGSAEWTKALAEKSEADPAHFATGNALQVALAEGIAKVSSMPVAGR